MNTSKTSKERSDLLKGLQIDSSDREHRRSSFPFKSIAAVIFVVGIVLVGFFHSNAGELTVAEGGHPIAHAAETQIERQPVAVEFPVRNSSVLDATGYVTARRQATVSSRITGKVVQVFIEEGDEVDKGQLLARLDNGLLEAQYRLSKAQLEAAKAGLLESEVQSHEAQLNLSRTKQLSERSLASRAELDKVLLNMDAIGARTIRVTREIEVAVQTVQLHKRLLAEAEIRAPFAGVVIDKSAQPGEIVSPMSAGGGFTRTGICTLVDMASLEIEVDVNESNINRVFPGQKVSAKLNSDPEREFVAQVVTIIPTADRNRATVKVRIKIMDNNRSMLPDMGVRVSFLENEG